MDNGRKIVNRCAIQSYQVEAAHDIASAIAYLHSMNVVFRDLKPVSDREMLSRHV